jgi:molybdopterin molybdotransferase
MRPFASLVSFAEAKARALGAVEPIARTERVPLERLAGRVLAREIVSAVDVPAFDRAMMDGYAVIAANTAGAAPGSPVTLTLTGAGFAGQAPDTSVVSGTCREIATGAPIPAGADAVVMVENTSLQSDRVSVVAAASAGQHIARRATDIERDTVVLEAGDVLSPPKLGAAAAIGVADALLYARPRAHVFSTGDEVVGPGEGRAGSVYDVNRWTLSALVTAHGGDARSRAPVPDTLDALRAAFDEASGADLLVCSGGSSVGVRDLLLDVVKERGEVIFHGMAVKPGKPTLVARIGRTLVFGMSGNPTSCLMNAYVLLVPALRAMAHLPPWEPRTLRTRLAHPLRSPADKHQFYPVRIENGRATPVFKGSGDVTSLSRADGYIEVPPGIASLAEGDEVVVQLFD